MFVVQRISDGQYVKSDRYGRSYTRDLDLAQRYQTWASANLATWDLRERVLDVNELERVK